MRKVLACSVAALFALSVPAEALFGGGGGKGSRGGGASSSKSSSSSKSRSTSRGGISAGASVGRGGISAGASIGGARAGASIGGGGVSAGASVGGTSAGASVGRSGAGVSASGGGISAGVNAGAGGVDASVSAGSLSVSGSVTTQGQSEDPHTSAAIATTGNSLLVVLPPELLPQRTSDSETRCEGPLGDCGARGPLLTGRASAAAPAAPQQRLRSEPGTPVPVVTACQRAAADAAQRYGARRVEAAGAGYLRRSGNGGLVAPVMLRITYGEGSAAQIRQAEVSCAMNAGGQVTAIT